MDITVQVAIEDEKINHIGIHRFDPLCVVFRTDDGNEIMLEKNTLERGLGVIEGERLIKEEGG